MMCKSGHYDKMYTTMTQCTPLPRHNALNYHILGETVLVEQVGVVI